MANWCITDIIIHCIDESGAKLVYDTINKWTEYSASENSWGGRWLGNLLINSGLYNAGDIDVKPHPACRGEITNIDVYKNAVSITTETAWAPMLKVWVELAHTFFNDCVDNITYIADEPGCGIHCTNDIDVAETWVYDDSSTDVCYDLSEDDVKECLLEYCKNRWSDVLDDNAVSVKELLDMIYDRDPSSCVDAYVYDYIDISELD